MNNDQEELIAEQIKKERDIHLLFYLNKEADPKNAEILDSLAKLYDNDYEKVLEVYGFGTKK